MSDGWLPRRYGSRPPKKVAGGAVRPSRRRVGRRSGDWAKHPKRARRTKVTRKRADGATSQQNFLAVQVEWGLVPVSSSLDAPPGLSLHAHIRRACDLDDRAFLLCRPGRASRTALCARRFREVVRRAR